MPDPRKDERYKDLNSEYTVLSDVLKSAAAWQKMQDDSLINESRQVQLEEARRGQAMRTALSEALRNGAGGSVIDKVKPVLAEYGDVDSLLKFEQQDRATDSALEAKKQRELNTIFKIAEVSPELATQMWNANFSEMGMMTPDKFQKPPQIKSGPGMLYHVDDSGKIVIDYEKPEKADSDKAPKQKLVKFKTSDGNIKYIDENDPQQRSLVEQGGLVPLAGSSGSDTAAFLKMLMGEDDDEETAMPAPAPTVTPKPKKRVIVMPKGISQ